MNKELKVIKAIKNLFIIATVVITLFLGIKIMVMLYKEYDYIKNILLFIVAFNIIKYVIVYILSMISDKLTKTITGEKKDE